MLKTMDRNVSYVCVRHVTPSFCLVDICVCVMAVLTIFATRQITAQYAVPNSQLCYNSAPCVVKCQLLVLVVDHYLHHCCLADRWVVTLISDDNTFALFLFHCGKLSWSKLFHLWMHVAASVRYLEESAFIFLVQRGFLFVLLWYSYLLWPSSQLARLAPRSWEINLWSLCICTKLLI